MTQITELSAEAKANHSEKYRGKTTRQQVRQAATWREESLIVCSGKNGTGTG